MDYSSIGFNRRAAGDKRWCKKKFKMTNVWNNLKISEMIQDDTI